MSDFDNLDNWVSVVSNSRDLKQLLSNYVVALNSVRPIWSRNITYVYRILAEDIHERKQTENSEVRKQMVKKQTSYGFVNIKLTPEEREHYRGWLESNGHPEVDDFVAILEDDYKLSVSYSASNDSWNATLTGRDTQVNNAYSVMTARHGTIHDALALLFYKHVIVSQGGTWRDDKLYEEWG